MPTSSPGKLFPAKSKPTRPRLVALGRRTSLYSHSTCPISTFLVPEETGDCPNRLCAWTDYFWLGQDFGGVSLDLRYGRYHRRPGFSILLTVIARNRVRIRRKHLLPFAKGEDWEGHCTDTLEHFNKRNTLLRSLSANFSYSSHVLLCMRNYGDHPLFPNPWRNSTISARTPCLGRRSLLFNLSRTHATHLRGQVLTYFGRSE